MADAWVVTMPKLGETVTEGTINSWLKNVGDTVAFDDPLFEVSTDKVDSEIPSPYDGTVLEILVPENETVPVGTPLVRIGEPGAAGGTATGSDGAGASGTGASGVDGGGAAPAGEDEGVVVPEQPAPASTAPSTGTATPSGTAPSIAAA